MKRASKIIFAILVVGVLLKATKTLFVQNNAAYISLEEVYGWYFKAGYYGNILVSIAAILSFIFYKKYFPGYVSVCYIAMMVLVTLSSLSSFENLLNKPNIFYSVKGIGTFVNFGILFFAANTVYFPKILKLFYYICFAFIIAGIINLGKVGLGASRVGYLNAISEFAVYLIWVFPFFLFENKSNKKINTLNLVVYAVILIFILSTWSRAYLIIYVVYLIVKFKGQLKSKNGLTVILAAGLSIFVGVSLFSGGGLAKALTASVNNLTERASEDSRSEQLTEFIDQYNTDYLLQGVGPLGTWRWSKWPVPYYYLDNQFLLLGWWAGLPTLLFYLYFIIKPITKKAEILLFENVQGVRLLIFIWILACAGFAIYVGISSDPYYDFVTLLIGLQTCKYTLLLYDEAET